MTSKERNALNLLRALLIQSKDRDVVIDHDSIALLYKEVKSAERTGKWTNKQYITFGGCSAECSQCHKRSAGYSVVIGCGFDHHFYEFCPRCGARMVTE